MHAVSGAAAPIAGRPPVELPPLTIAPGGRSIPPDDLTAELAALAELLAARQNLYPVELVMPLQGPGRRRQSASAQWHDVGVCLSRTLLEGGDGDGR
ncbi:MAG: hypothetical protein ACRDS0_11735 [Pseudonocardiaceae bacterium]